MKLLSLSSARYLSKHRWQSALSILGIAIGVAVAVSIDLANQSARTAFSISMDRVAGRATHHIIGAASGFAESQYLKLRLERSIRNCAPVVEGFVKAERDTNRTFTLLGVDPFAEAPFRTIIPTGQRLDLWMNHPASILLLRKTAKDLDIKPGDSFLLIVNGIRKSAYLAGYLMPEEKENSLGYEDLMVTDIASAQELLGKLGRLSRIDLIIPQTEEGARQLERIERFLDPGLSVIRSESRSGSAEQMVEAFNLNMTAMSLLALIVGMFLIYNTMTFSVMRRKQHLGLLRSMGTTRGEIFRLVLAEAFMLGAVGTAAGTVLGILMAQGLVDLVSRTINDLYFVVSIRKLDLSPPLLIKGIGLGLSASLLAAFFPARTAMGSPPVSMLKRSLEETGFGKRIPLFSAAGLLSILAGIAVFKIPSSSILLGYMGILHIILGFALLTPLALLVAARFLKYPLRAGFGLIGSMVAQSFRGQMSRISVAVAALGLAVSATVGVATTVASFRSTVVDWLDRRLEADIYVSAPGLVSRRNDADLPDGLVREIAKLPGCGAMNYYRETQVRFRNRIVNVIGARIEPQTRERFTFKEGALHDVWPALESGEAVIVSEPFAFQNNVQVGDALQLPTDRGHGTFSVAGIYYDYGSDLGYVTMTYATYTRWWDDPKISGIAVYLNEGTDIEEFMDGVRGLSNGDLVVRTNRILRDRSIEIFDRTFLIANVLQFLAVAVAFIGVLSALMAIQLERGRELAILRANGLTGGQMGALVILQSGVAGLFAGIFSLPLGSVLAWALIYIINQRSFGWTLQFVLNPLVFVQAVLLALAASVIAGLYPARKLAAEPLAAALREE